MFIPTVSMEARRGNGIPGTEVAAWGLGLKSGSSGRAASAFFKLLSHFFSFHVPFKTPEAVNGKAKDHC